MTAQSILKDSKFVGTESPVSKVGLDFSTMHGGKQCLVDDTNRKNWVFTVGTNIDVIENQFVEYSNCGYAVALSVGIASFYLVIKMARKGLCVHARSKKDPLQGHRVDNVINWDN